MAESPLFAALTQWVEAGVAPDYVVAQVNPTRTRKVCMYPNVPRYLDTGSTDDEANFDCELRHHNDPDLLRKDADLLLGNGPLPFDADIDLTRKARPAASDALTSAVRSW